MKFFYFLLLLVSILHYCSAAQNCAWFVGRLRCSRPELLANTVVEIWDHDRPFFPLSLLNEDDLAGRTIITEEDNGTFRVEGCASDSNFVVIKNQPEFYLKIRHSCKGSSEVKVVYPPNMQIFVPETNDYYTNHPIVLG